MEKNFRMTKIARSMGLVLGSCLISPYALADNTCTTYSEGTCGLKQFEVTTSLTPKGTAWYFTSPTQDAAINKDALSQTIYFASGTSARGTDGVQNLLVDGANLTGKYINTSNGGSASVTLANNASVDFIEIGNNVKDLQIKVDNSVINGAQNAWDYDQRASNKNYAAGVALYLYEATSGDQKVDIVNGSVLNGRILASGTGKHEINIEDSQINKGAIVISAAVNDNIISIKNGRIDTTNAVTKTDKAIQITNVAKQDTLNNISLDNSQLNGTVSVTNSSAGINNLSLSASSIAKTTNTNGDAVNISGGTSTGFAASDSAITGNTVLTANQSVNADLKNSRLAGDLTLSKALQATINLANSTLDGMLDASGLKGSIDLQLTDNTLIKGDVNLNGAGVIGANVTLDNALIQGNLYGSTNSSLNLAQSMTEFDGNKFSNFDRLNLSGPLTLNGGFTNSNVGQALQVNGGTVTTLIALSSGKLAFNGSQIIADTLALSDSASLELNNKSLLQTNSAQLFNQDASASTPEGFNATGSRIQLDDSTLALTDSTYHLDYVKSLHQLLDSQSDSHLVMMGQLMDGDTITGSATLNDAAVAGAILAQVQVNSDKSHLIVGSSIAPTADHAAVENSFGAAQLMLGSAPNASVQIVGSADKVNSLTLTGAKGGALIGVQGMPDANVSVAVSDYGMLNLGTRAIGDTSGTLLGNINVAGNGEMNVIAGSYSLTSADGSAALTSSGTVNIHQNAALASDVALQSTAQLYVEGALNAQNLTASQDAMIRVGSNDAAGSLVVQNADLQGARMFIDPAWLDGATISDASQVLMAGNEINGRLTIGQNSLLVLGDTSNTAALNNFANSGFNWGADGITAAVAISSPQSLAAGMGGLRVDGSLNSASTDRDATSNQAEFGDHSLLMVDAAGTTAGNAALNATGGTLKVADSAALYVADAKANNTYTIANGFTDIERSANGWQGANLVLNKLLNATTAENNGAVTVTTSAKNAQDVLPGIVVGNALNSMIGSGTNSLTSPDAGIRLLSQAVEDPNVSTAQAVKTLNSAAQLAIAGGVQSSMLATGMAAVDAIQNRLSLADHDMQKGDNTGNVWVQALYGNQRNRDLSASQMSYGTDTNFYGMMLGGDVAYDTTVGKMRSGAAFHAGNGKTDSTGDFNSTRNDFSFWGVSLYQNWASNGFSVTGDAGFSASNNDLNQQVPGWTNMDGKLKGSVDAQLFTVGITGEYLISTAAVDIIPHVGARYNQLTTKAFDTKDSQNNRVFTTDKERQDIWQFPVGVKLNKTFALDSGWNVSPQADVAVIAAAGDTGVSNSVRVSGINASDIISADVMDKTAFNGQLGLKAQKGNMTFGIGYNVNASEHSTGQTIGATYKLSF